MQNGNRHKSAVVQVNNASNHQQRSEARLWNVILHLLPTFSVFSFYFCFFICVCVILCDWSFFIDLGTSVWRKTLAVKQTGQFVYTVSKLSQTFSKPNLYFRACCSCPWIYLFVCSLKFYLRCTWLEVAFFAKSWKNYIGYLVALICSFHADLWSIISNFDEVK